MKSLQSMFLLVLFFLFSFFAHAENKENQQDKIIEKDPVVSRGIYSRPYLLRAGNVVAIGGYAEFLGNYFAEKGISDGFGFEARRFNLFLFSQLSHFIRLSAEIEFEHGTEEIKIEMALVDIRFHRTFNLRAGIILPPIGKFNITHDSPIYEILERPLVSTRIIPSTYSDTGVGATGAFYFPKGHKLYYELYAVNGLGAGIIQTSDQGTRISQGKTNALFGGEGNGVPAFAGRIAYTSPLSFEVGVSSYLGIYNSFQKEREKIDEQRWLKILALDAEVDLGPVTIRTEAALALIDIEESLQSVFASMQWGFYTDVIWTFWQGPLGMMSKASFQWAFRVDYVDMNVGNRSPNDSIGDENLRLTIAFSFRPIAQTSLRLGYFHEWKWDDFSNVRRAIGIQMGLASYF